MHTLMRITPLALAALAGTALPCRRRLTMAQTCRPWPTSWNS